MKILLVLEHFQPYIGGAEELFSGLAKSLVAEGNEVTVVTTLHNKLLPRTEMIDGINVVRIKCYNRFLFTFFSLPSIIKYARKADFIQTASYNAALPTFFAGLFCKKKVVITFHEVWGKLWFQLPFTNKLLLFAYYWYEQLILKLPFYRYVAVSKFTYKALLSNGVPESKVKLIYNGLDYAKFENHKHREPERFTFCFFGRLGISKGLELIPQAFAEVVKSNPNVLLKLIVPQYPKSLYDKFVKQLQSHIIKANIILKHDLTKEELFNEIRSSSCILIPSYSEGFCFTAAEATALQVPIISSGKGALIEVVGGKHIHLKSLTAGALADAMLMAIRNEYEITERLKFSLQKSVESYNDLYAEIEKN
jgi:glycosyltransferase involved in cell wall biosynthesis